MVRARQLRLRRQRCADTVHPSVAYQWMEQYADMHPTLKDALADDKIQKRARDMTRLWVRKFKQRVYELRGSAAIVAQRNLSQVHRTTTEMMRALVMRHDTVRCFLSECVPLFWISCRLLVLTHHLASPQAFGRLTAVAECVAA